MSPFLNVSWATEAFWCHAHIFLNKPELYWYVRFSESEVFLGWRFQAPDFIYKTCCCLFIVAHVCVYSASRKVFGRKKRNSAWQLLVCEAIDQQQQQQQQQQQKQEMKVKLQLEQNYATDKSIICTAASSNMFVLHHQKLAEKYQNIFAE